MIMGGRVMRAAYKGDMGGMPFEGISFLGYDNAKKTFWSTWFDTTSTSLTVATGAMDEATKVVSIKGTTYDATSDQDYAMRIDTAYDSKEKFVMTMYMGEGAQELKVMEIVHTRN